MHTTPLLITPTQVSGFDHVRMERVSEDHQGRRSVPMACPGRRPPADLAAALVDHETLDADAVTAEALAAD